MLAAEPSLSGLAPSGETRILLGEAIGLGFNFVNTSATDTGFSPFLEVALDTSGPDGATSFPLDGISAPTLTSTGLQRTPIGSVTLTSGQTTWTNPYTGTTRPVPAGFGANDTIYVYSLPFGSFTPSQTTSISFAASTSNLADIGTPMRISVVPGFRDIDAVGPFTPLFGSVFHTDVTPELYRLSKTNSAVEGETATGPNYVQRYRIEVDLPAGQAFSNVRIFDTLASSMQILGRNATSVAGNPNMAAYLLGSGSPGANVFDASRLTGTAQSTSPGGTLNYDFGNMTGVGGADAAFEFNFYIPRDHANPPGGQVLPQTATSGTDSNVAVNTANSQANWNPLDPRDPQNQAVFAPGAGQSVTASLEQQSIAVQKSVAAIDPTTGAAAASIVPGRTLLRYSISFQVSDYYAFDDVVLRDVMSDGQRLFVGTRGAVNAFPTMSVSNAYLTGATTGSRVNTSGNFQGTGVIAYQRRHTTGDSNADPTGFPANGPALGTVNPTVFTNLTPQPDTDVNTGGRTFLQFNVSQELRARLGATAGRLVGGEIGNDGSGPHNNPRGSQLFPGTTGTIVFYSEVRETFSDAHPSTDISVDQGDILGNSVDDPATGSRDGITGAQLRPATINAPTATVIGTGTDDSGSSISIPYGLVEKQVYAINGVLVPPQAGFEDTLTVQAGDRVTFRLTYTLPLSSFEDVRIIDIAPLPIMRVADSAPFTFIRNPASYTFQTGQVGVLDLAGANPHDDTYFSTFDPTLVGVRNPTLSTSATNNELILAFGTHDDIPQRRGSQISILVTFVISNDPFVNDLYLTNQLRIEEASTNAGDTTAERIRQIELVRPFVSVQKGAVAANGLGLTSGNIAFAPATNATGRLTVGGNALSASNSINSAAQAAAIGGLNISSANAPVDAGDTVRYALVVQNTGEGDAFDIRVTDQVQPGYVIPASFSGLNFRGFRGDGTTLVLGADYTLESYNSTTGAFEIQLTDNYTAGNLGGAAEDARSGALSRGATRTAPITNGSNTVLFLYDLQLSGSVAPNSSITNTATVTRYSNQEAGPDVTDPAVLPGVSDPITTANTTTVSPAIAKALTSTDLTTIGNTATQATIGEMATYTVTLTVPEGVTPNARISDSLQDGLAFTRLISVTPSNPSALTFTNSFGTLPGTQPANVTVTSAGQTVAFDFGTITNTNRDNAVPETITLVYEAVVLNTAGNQAGGTRTNSARISWQNNPNTVAPVSAGAMTLVEPTLTAAKQVRNATRGGTFATSASGDSQDVMQYRITVANGNLATDTMAFDVLLNDVLPSVIQSPSIVSATSTGGVLINGTAGTVAIGDLQLAGSTLTFNRNIDMPRNSSITIVVEGQLQGGLGAPIDNFVDVTWTSLDGAVSDRSIHNAASDERAGAGGVDDYTSRGQATIDSPPLVRKRIMASSESHTVQPQVAVGEIVRYRLVSTLPEGTSRHVILQDSLPAGLRFLNDGTARYAFISTSGSGITSLGITDIAGLGTAGGRGGSELDIGALLSSDVTGLFNDSNISPTVLGAGTGDAPLYNSAQSVSFRFGDLANSENDLDNEYVVVEFNALVANQTENQAGFGLNNAFTVLADANLDGVPGYLSVAIDDNGNGVRDLGENTVAAIDADNNATTAPNTLAFSNVASLAVGEPALSIDKQAIATTGAIVTYRVTVTNASGANIAQAFNTRVVDTLDGVNLSLRSGSVSAVAFTGGANGASDNSSGNTLDVAITAMPPGATATFTYQANVLTTPAGTTTVDNTARVTYTSLPGTAGTGDNWTGVAATSSTVPGAAGSASGERTGADGAGQPNDYAASDVERLGSLGDRVWVDLNNNGAQDSGEPGIVAAPLSVRWAGRNGIFDDADDSLISTATGADGVYLVTGLPIDTAGVYRVVVDTAAAVFVNNSLTTQTFDADGLSTANRSQIALTASTPNPRTQDFGYRGPGSIGDRVFLDVDNDGVYDAGEGINNASLQLNGDFDGDGASETVSTTTDTDGFYQFSGLRVTSAGVAYTVSVVTAGLPAGVSQSFDPDGTLNNQSTTTLSNATVSDQTRDFGYRGPGSIGDSVFLDINNNGVADSGEGITNVTVTLTGDLDGDGANESVTAITDANGAYLFSGLRTTVGGVAYTVTITTASLPAELTPSFDPDGTINHQSTATLTNAAPANLTRDFGYRGAGIVGDTVFLDVNNNGVVDPGEGIASITVTLTGDHDADGVDETVTTTTNAGGAYQFSGLRTASTGVLYTVAVVNGTLPGGLDQSFDPDGVRDHRAATTLTNAAASDLTRDFGYRGPGAVGDTVFLDVNNNGQADAGEGIANVTITLTGDLNGDSVDESVTATTDTNGFYQFSGLRVTAGGVAYTAIVSTATLPSGVSQSFDPDGSLNHRSTATLTVATPSDLSRDFGYRGFGVIGDSVFLDVNNNNAADAGEGISNVTVTLTGDLDSDGTPETVTATTDANGAYMFSGLRTTTAGLTYTVAVAGATLPSGLSQSFDPDGTRDNVATATLTNAAFINQTRDFGYRGAGTVGDTIFLDVNNNGVADTGEGLANITVTLTGDHDSDGVGETVSTTTDTNGFYQFTGLRTSAAGVVYTSRVDTITLPGGLSQTFDPDGTLDHRASVTLTNASPVDATRDLGYRGPGVIGDFVFLDVNNNGQADSGEGISNVAVSLTGDLDGDGSDETVVATTDANGQYQFSGLRITAVNVTYRVTVDSATLPSGLAQSFDPDGTLDHRALASLSSIASSNLARDFGYRGLGSIGDTIFPDINNNNAADPGEGLLGVSVSLTGDLDGDGVDETVTTTTDTNGLYAFSGLRTSAAGVIYTVIVNGATVPAGLTQSFDPDGTRDNRATTTLTNAAPTDATRDFGYRGPGSIGDTVFLDVNNNGQADAGEGIANVTITLTGDLDGDAADESVTTTTNADGGYQFSGLRTTAAGVAYTVLVSSATLPSGLTQSFDPDPTRDNRALATLTTAAPGNQTRDFGYRGSGAVGDTVFLDINNNNVADTGEGISNVTVTMTGDLDADGLDETVSATTDGNGVYQFSGLRTTTAGVTYSVAVSGATLPAGLSQSFDPDGIRDNRANATLTNAAPTNQTRDFGYRGPGALGDTIFLDVNNNGAADPGEGLANVTVTLTGDHDGDGIDESITMTSDTNGAYQFNGLRTSAAGVAYTVTVVSASLPAGLAQSFDPDGSLNNSAAATLTNAAPNDSTRDFGYRGPGSIGDTVFLDVNNNGQADTGEGITNVTVTLTGDLDGDGADETVTATTDASGLYQFSGLRTTVAGVAYTVLVNSATLPAGLSPAFDPDGTLDHRAIATLTNAAPSNATRDFGYRGPGSIGDTVFPDINNNGQADPGEGIINVTVSLTGDLDGDGVDETVTTATDTNGAYLFSGLRTTAAGVVYTVIVNGGTLPSGLSQSFDPDGTRDNRATTTLTVAAPTDSTRDFGYRGPGSIGDIVFLDVNNNGLADSGEGIANATVTLAGDLDGDGADETVTTTTDTDGFYQFSGLRTTVPGVAYTLTVAAATLPAGLIQSFDPDGTRDNRTIANLTSAAPSNQTRDFGYRGPGVIGDVVFLDINNNGLADAGEGISNVTAALTGDLDGDGADDTVTATTDSNGAYQFSGLRTTTAGVTYTVAVSGATLPAGLSASVDPDPIRDNRATATLTTAAPSNLTRDFGYRGPGAVGDAVFFDINNNGLADPGEGIANVLVTLTGDHDGDGADESVVTTTDTNGLYRFDGLRTSAAGVAYAVTISTATLPAGVTQSFDPDIASDNRSVAIVTNAAPSDLARDFGYRGPGSVGDTVFLDINNNGQADPGEGITNVMLTLTGDLDGDGAIETVSTSTDANGQFLFSGLLTTAAGVSYTIAVNPATLPLGFLPSFDPDGTLDQRAVATLTNSAPSNLSRDFGYRGPGSIGDTIFPDINNNGQADPGEGIINVAVLLTGDLDGDGVDETVTTTTDTNGSYQFSGLRTTAAGVVYAVIVNSATLPSGLSQSFDPDGTRDNRTTTTLSNSSPADATRDFGYRGPGSVGDTVFVDVNNNAMADPGEGLAGATVTLAGDLDGDGADESVVATTDTNGFYQFSGLRTAMAGVAYSITVANATIPAGLIQSYDPDGTRDHRAVANLTTAAPSDQSRDFGYRGPGSVGDSVFLDINNNGIADPGEGLSNVIVTLTGDLDGDGVDETVAATTDGQGAFQFSGLRTTPAGVSYAIAVAPATLPAGLSPSFDPDSTRDNRSTVTLTSAMPANPSIDFGYRGPGTIGDAVFVDINNNSTSDPGEGLANVTVTLTADIDGDGTDETVSLLTDTHGFYQFSGLRTTVAGVSYTVMVASATLPPGLSPSFDADGAPDNRSSTTLTNAAPSDQTRDFGYRGPGLVGDTVFLDVNNNGQADPGEGITNVAVTLTGDLDGDAADETVAAITDANGQYQFSGLRATNAGVAYTIAVNSATLPSGISPSFDPDNLLDHRAMATLANSVPIDLTRDFGYRGLGRIGDSLFLDVNNNGIPDPGEGLSNVTVTLTGDLDGDGVDETVTAVTDANGNYAFSGLRTTAAGVAYVVVVNSATLPSGIDPSFDPDGTRDYRSTVALTNAAPADSTRSFGFRGLGAVGDTVFVDVNNNGMADPGEGIANVAVTLTGDHDGDGVNETLTTTTDTNGRYSFTGLRTTVAGVAYTATIVPASLPPGFNQSFDADGTLDNRSTTTLTNASPSGLSRDFGYRGAGIAGDSLFIDVNNNGRADVGEGISNVAVTLTGDLDGDGMDETVSTLTDSDGAYRFSGLRTTAVGVVYSIAVNGATVPTGLAASFDPDGTVDQRSDTTLTNAAPSDLTRDFGYRGPGAVSDTVFIDVNNNGVAEPGEGIANVVLTLTGDLDTDGVEETVTATTDMDGRYLFSGLRTTASGLVYAVAVNTATLPAGLGQSFDPDSTRDSRALATLTNAAPSDASRDFGYRGPGSTGNTIFLDVNNNGVADPGEGIANVTVALIGDLDGDGIDETVITTTDTDGGFRFAGLRTTAGGVPYTVAVDIATLPPGMNATFDPDGMLDHRVIAMLSDTAPSDPTRNLGYRGPGSVGDIVFLDINNNGVADPGEGITNVALALTGDLDGDGSDETVVTTTDANGGYVFSGLRTTAVGVAYTVAVGTLALPAGLNQSFDPDSVRDNRSTAILSTASPADSARDFGYRGLGSLGDTVFIDVNNNGVPDPGEGLANATISLTGDHDGDGVAETVTTVTDTNGGYQFTGLRTSEAGVAYTVAVDNATVPAGFSPSFDPDGVLDNRSIAALSNSLPSIANRDFGYRGPGSIGDAMFLDINNNGVVDPGEGLGNVAVTLTGDLDGDGVDETVTAVTDANGAYLFSGLRTTPAGVSYTVATVTASIPAGLNPSYDVDGVLDNRSTTTLTNTAPSDQTRELGYRGPGSIGDTLFLDVNNNGLADPGEGLAGVTITLTGDHDADGMDESVTTTTDLDGRYLFSGLRTTPVGVTYLVTVAGATLPSSLSQSFDSDSTLDNRAAATLTNAVPSNSTRDFGYRGPGSIDNTVFVDVNGNGIADPGERIANVTVTLTGDLDGDGQIETVSTTTDANGHYRFTGLRTTPGGVAYTVAVDTATLPPGFVPSFDPDSTLDNRSAVTLTSAAPSDQTRDFGYRGPGTIGDAVFIDINNNGLVDSGEGIANVMVSLIGDIDGNGIDETVTAVTNTDGGYLFGGLRTTASGVAYLTRVDATTVPSGLAPATDPDGIRDHQATANLSNSIPANLTRDFGYRGPGSVSDSVFLDVNNNGVADPGEGLGNVIVTLTGDVDGDGALETVTVVTDANGVYQFSGLRTTVAGVSYSVAVSTASLPPGLTQSFDPDGTSDHRSITTLSAAAPGDQTRRFGYRGPGVIGDAVFLDADNNGRIDPREGLAGVVVTLTGDLDGDGVEEAVTTTTDANGAYRFSGLRTVAAGVPYTVSVGAATVPAGLLPSFDPDGTVDQRSIAVLANVAPSDLERDFGYRGPADLRLTKRNAETLLFPTLPTTYTFEVFNDGPFPMAGARVAEVVPAGLNFVSASTGSSYDAALRTLTFVTGRIEVNASATFTATFTVDVRAPRTIVNTASVAPPAGIVDPDPSDNTATDTDPVLFEADLSVSLSDGSSAYQESGTRVYTLVVVNRADLPVSEVRVRNLLPPEFASATWTAAFSPGSSGTAAGAGGIDEQIALAGGGSAIYTIHAVVKPNTGGRLVNTATVTPPAWLVDPQSSNNTSTDINKLPLVVTATEIGCKSAPLIAVLDPLTGQVKRQILLYEASFRGGVRVAVGDVDADGVDEIVAAPGPGRAGEVRVFERDGTELTAYRSTPFGAAYRNGVEIAVGDIDGDGDDDLVASATRGPGEVRVFRVNPGQSSPVEANPFKTFRAFATNFLGGATVAVADLGTFANGATVSANTPDGKLEIVVGSGAGMRAQVSMYEVSGNPRLIDTVLPMENNFRNGISVAAARVNADGIDDIIVSGGRGAGSIRETYNGRIDLGANALLHRDAVFAELSTAAPLFTAPVDLDGDQLADTFFHALGDQGQQPHAGVRVTDPPGADSMTIPQLDYSQRLASSRPARSPGMTTAASGLMFEDLQVGTGNQPTPSGEVSIRYVATRVNGMAVANNLSDPLPASFRLDSPAVMAGLRAAIVSMRAGGVRRVTVPSHLQGGTVPGGLPAGAPLVFEIQLMSATG